MESVNAAEVPASLGPTTLTSPNTAWRSYRVSKMRYLVREQLVARLSKTLYAIEFAAMGARLLTSNEGSQNHIQSGNVRLAKSQLFSTLCQLEKLDDVIQEYGPPSAKSYLFNIASMGTIRATLEECIALLNDLEGLEIRIPSLTSRIPMQPQAEESTLESCRGCLEDLRLHLKSLTGRIA